MFTGMSQCEPRDEQLFSFMWHLSEMERSGPYGEPQMGPHPPQADIAQSSWFFLMEKTSPSVSENRKEVAVGSPMYSFSLVLSHFAGVYAPKALPLSDLASINVGALPTHCSLNTALWKLCWLALKSNLAEESLLFICENISPTFLRSSLGKTGEASLKMLPMLSSPVDEVFQNSRYSLTILRLRCRKVCPEGQSFVKSSRGAWEVVRPSISQMQLSLTPPTSKAMTENSLILLRISSFCSRRDYTLLTLTFSLKTKEKSSLGYVLAYRMKLRWLRALISVTRKSSNSRSMRSLRFLRATSSWM